MASVRNGMFKGRVGDKVYKTRYGKTYVASVPASVAQPRTQAQMMQRSKMPNVTAMYRAFKPFAKSCFELPTGGENVYNRFMSVNLHGYDVFITKEIAKMKGGIVAPYWVSQGCLDPIEVTGSGNDAVTDIKLGALEIGAETTVSEFAAAVVANNEGYELNDKISFLLFRQTVDEVTQVPYIHANAWTVKLSGTEAGKLSVVAGSVGFTSRDGRLGISSEALGDCAFCWVHTRTALGGKTLASSQRLIAHNSLLHRYMNADAQLASMTSYGMKEAAFIEPTLPYLNG